MHDHILPQCSLFDYTDNEDIGDLKRLVLCLEEMPYQHLIAVLDEERKYGRNDYRNHSMFFILIAMLLFAQRIDFSHMRRLLSGNPHLRSLVGLNDEDYRCRGMSNIPSNDAFSHFIDRLDAHIDLLQDMFVSLRDKLYQLLPDFGIRLAGDGKYLDSFAPNKHSEEAKDNRGERDATYSLKVYYYADDKGEKHSKKETHYGFRKHTLVDTFTELPVASVLRPANEDERGIMYEMICDLPNHIKDRVSAISLNRGYDSIDIITLIKDIEALPIVDKRIMKPLDKLTRYKDTDFYYNDKADVYYYDRDNAIYNEMLAEAEKNGEKYKEAASFILNDCRYYLTSFTGYDKTNNVLRYHYKDHKVRINIKVNERVFLPVARNTKAFKSEYNERTSVERYHSRLDQCLGFECHTIRGYKKMNVFSILGDIVLLSLAIAHIRLGQKNYASVFDFGLI